MKHVLTALLLISSLIVFANVRGGEEQIFLQKKKVKDGHTEYFDPADKPEVYYDRDNQEIVLVADGFASSYDVDIFSMSSMQCVLYTTISGYGDTIDVSSLPDDDYKIVISTPYHNIYEGYFTNY